MGKELKFKLNLKQEERNKTLTSPIKATSIREQTSQHKAPNKTIIH